MSPKDPKSAKNNTGNDNSSSENASDGVISIDDIRIRHELPRVLPGFEAWSVQEKLGVRSDPLRATITEFLRHYACVNGNRTLTNLRLPPFATALDDFMFSKKPNDFLDMVRVIGFYLRFLNETGTWSGTAEEFRRVQNYFGSLQVPDYGPNFSEIPELQAVTIKVPKLSTQEASEGIEELPLTERLRSFLSWLGTKREVTSTRILNRKLVQEAAASLGVLAVDDAVTPFVWPRPAGGPVIFKNANHVPRLRLYWKALLGAEVIELSTTRAYPSETAKRFLEGRADDVITVVRRVAQQMYRALAEEIESGYTTPEMGYLTRYYLLEAAVEPASVEVLKHPVRGLNDGDPRGDPEVIQEAWRRLEQLQEEGLVAIGAKISIPPVLFKPLVLELAAPSAVDYDFEEPDDEDPNYTGSLS